MRRSIIAHIFPHLSFTRVKKRPLICEGSCPALLSWGRGSTAGWVRDGTPRCSGRERPAVQAFPSAAAVLHKQRRVLRQPAGRMCGLLKSSQTNCRDRLVRGRRSSRGGLWEWEEGTLECCWDGSKYYGKESNKVQAVLKSSDSCCG